MQSKQSILSALPDDSRANNVSKLKNNEGWKLLLRTTNKIKYMYAGVYVYINETTDVIIMAPQAQPN